MQFEVDIFLCHRERMQKAAVLAFFHCCRIHSVACHRRLFGWHGETKFAAVAQLTVDSR